MLVYKYKHNELNIEMINILLYFLHFLHLSLVQIT